MNIFDVGIIGAGVGGAFAALKIAKDHKDLKAIVFDGGRPPMKRRRQLEGWLGCFPSGDGKLYLSDLDYVSNLTGLRKSKSSFTWFNKILSQVDDFKIIKDKIPSASIKKKLTKLNYSLQLNDYIQLYPKDIHALSKNLADTIENSNNISFKFDTEVKNISKNKNIFIIHTDNQEFKCKKIIIAAGRSGWRWSHNLYKNFGILDNNDYARFGIRVEINSNYLKDFNKSNCTFIKENEYEIGPLSWFGTVIPEDHVDMAISSFRSNENRWKTDKVSFSLISNRHFPNNGFEQTDRIAKLAFLLSNDRIIREKISYILSDKSKISVIPEFNWLKESIIELSEIIPDILSKGYFHIPTIATYANKINIANNLETEVKDMFVIGESAGVHGILSAATTGIIAADNACQ